MLCYNTSGHQKVYMCGTSYDKDGLTFLACMLCYNTSGHQKVYMCGTSYDKDGLTFLALYALLHLCGTSGDILGL